VRGSIRFAAHKPEQRADENLGDVGVSADHDSYDRKQTASLAKITNAAKSTRAMVNFRKRC
jgi:hypothetical protein